MNTAHCPAVGPNSSLLQAVQQQWSPARVSAARPHPWSGRGDPNKTGAIHQRGKAASSREQNFWDSFVRGCEAPREQSEEVMLGGPSFGGGEVNTHQENSWQQADFGRHLESDKVGKPAAAKG